MLNAYSGLARATGIENWKVLSFTFITEVNINWSITQLRVWSTRFYKIIPEHFSLPLYYWDSCAWPVFDRCVSVARQQSQTELFRFQSPALFFGHIPFGMGKQPSMIGQQRPISNGRMRLRTIPSGIGRYRPFLDEASDFGRFRRKRSIWTVY